jgi:uncharacterized protein
MALAQPRPARPAADAPTPGDGMSEATPDGERIATLDIVRGVAVMGILAMNIVGFAMPDAAYMNPAAYGTNGPADLASWAISFVFVDGKMRGLFSFLFGASLLLVVDRAEASGLNPARIHYARMFWLLVFGLIHFYLIWWGDILSLYAPVGMVAYFFRRWSPTALIGVALALIGIQLLRFAGLALLFHQAAAAAASPGAGAEVARQWADMQDGFGRYAPAELADILARFRGSYDGIADYMLSENLIEPLRSLVIFGWETLAYMLLGMAALKSGFLTGGWANRRYVRVMLIGFGIGVPAYALLAWLQIAGGFNVPDILTYGLAATVPLRPLMIGATGAAIILLTRGGGALVARVAAAGRAAFSNYLGTSILMTALFYGWGFGLYGHLSRIQLWIPVVAMWILMLLWSKPWLERFDYGPFEWLWRSLARWKLQPMRKAAARK